MKKAVSVIRFGLWCALAVFSGTLLIGSSAYLFLSPSLPSVDSLRDINFQTPLRIYSADNKLIAEFGEKRRTPVDFEQVPKELIDAFLAAEDDRFYSHNGVDIVGLARATVQLVSTGSIQSGGSTITMQVAKNFFLSHERVFSRKFNEILLALEIERKLSKQEIMELYLNKIYLGNRAYGIEAAAQVYYGKTIQELTLPQMAMIAGLPKAPSRYNPLVNLTRALERRDWILGRMKTLGMISEPQYTFAVNTPPTATFHGLPVELEAPYVAEMVRMEVIEKLGTAAYTDGYKVYTTINSAQQKAANLAIDKGLQAYDERHGFRGPELQLGESLEIWQQTLKNTSPIGSLEPVVVTEVHEDRAILMLRDGSPAVMDFEQMKWAKPYIDVNRQGKAPKQPSDIVAVGDLIRVRHIDGTVRLSQLPEAQAAIVAMQPKDGAITAIVGGFNFYDSKYNRVTQANRQVGSAFKPFIYTAAINKGMTAATLINDAPVVFNDDQLESHWRPQNDNQKFYGPTRLRKGLYRSRNLVSIRILQRTGIDYTLDLIEQLGMPRDKMPDNLSLSLGSAGITPMELATGYTVLANGGFRIEPYIIQHIDQLDKTIYQADPLIACRNCDETPEAETSSAQTIPAEEGFAAGFSEEGLTLESILEENPINPDGSLTTTDPKELLKSVKKAPRVMDERVNYIVYDMMKDVITEGTGRRAKALNRNDLAGKTGTTNDQRDVWFSGFNPELQATVWMGFDQPKTLGRWEYGANAALPVWIDFMKVALANKPETSLPQPDGIVTMKINPETGKPARPDETNAIFEVFRTENAPKPEFEDEETSTNDNGDFNPGDIF
ncbi:penicillin-binding protein 1A [Parendozoicomonas haliclonae]|uniref:Penicillin-binding protein 1A n=1 Tax=Parendozoicomonas haliclonae TaxID=1960125 RepID=A0A1X7AEW1_9GAMM|nr:penicillin-binding protein 1A [Parendozoicomonas haliclonae]SMA35918.1 Penicillin-binding protein 1A [Parendozoicomonas haliclonae]